MSRVPSCVWAGGRGGGARGAPRLPCPCMHTTTSRGPRDPPLTAGAGGLNHQSTPGTGGSRSSTKPKMGPHQEVDTGPWVPVGTHRWHHLRQTDSATEPSHRAPGQQCCQPGGGGTVEWTLLPARAARATQARGQRSLVSWRAGARGQGRAARVRPVGPGAPYQGGALPRATLARGWGGGWWWGEGVGGGLVRRTTTHMSWVQHHRAPLCSSLGSSSRLALTDAPARVRCRGAPPPISSPDGGGGPGPPPPSCTCAAGAPGGPRPAHGRRTPPGCSRQRSGPCGGGCRRGVGGGGEGGGGRKQVRTGVAPSRCSWSAMGSTEPRLHLFISLPHSAQVKPRCEDCTMRFLCLAQVLDVRNWEQVGGWG